MRIKDNIRRILKEETSVQTKLKNKIDSLRFNEQLKLVETGKFVNKSKFSSIEDSIVFYAKQQQGTKNSLEKFNSLPYESSTSKTSSKIN